jgi:hypothetical protein
MSALGHVLLVNAGDRPLRQSGNNLTAPRNFTEQSHNFLSDQGRRPLTFDAERLWASIIKNSHCTSRLCSFVRYLVGDGKNVTLIKRFSSKLLTGKHFFMICQRWKITFKNVLGDFHGCDDIDFKNNTNEQNKNAILNQGKLCKRIDVWAKFKNFIIAAFSF